MRVTVDEFIAGTGAKFAGKTIGILALRGRICVFDALTILDGVVLGTRSLDLDAGIGVAGRDAGIDDAAGNVVEVDAWMSNARHRDAVEADVIAGNETIPCPVEVKRGRTGDGHARRNVTLAADTVRAGDRDRGAGFSGLDGINDICT